MSEHEVSADPVVRRRSLLLFSFVVDIAALCLIAAAHHLVWRWSLVAWGVVVGLLGLALVELTFVVILRKTDVPRSRRATLRKRQPVYVAGWVTSGVILGLLSAIINRAAIDISGAGLVILSQLLGILLALRVVHRSSPPRAE